MIPLNLVADNVDIAIFQVPRKNRREGAAGAIRSNLTVRRGEAGSDTVPFGSAGFQSQSVEGYLPLKDFSKVVRQACQRIGQIIHS